MPVGFAVKPNVLAHVALALLVLSWAGRASAAPLSFHLSIARDISAGEEKTASTTSGKRQESPSQKAVEIARPFGFPITNSMVVSWIVAVGLILFAQFATRHMKPVPEGAQNFWEWLVEELYTFLEGIIGSRLVQRT